MMACGAHRTLPRQTIVDVTFTCDEANDGLLPHAANRRIVQEAVVNTAGTVALAMSLAGAGITNARWVVSIEDDERGFPFSGRWSHWELEGADRVRSSSANERGHYAPR